MDAQYRVQRVLCQAQYGDILLCEVAPGAMKSDESNTTTETAFDRFAVIKQVAWTRVEATRPSARGQPLQLADDPLREVDVAAKICAAGSHKHVVRYHKVLHGAHGSFGIVMEFCNDGDLLKRLDLLQCNRMAQAEALHVLHQVARGLGFLHSIVGIAHRDVSLENIMVRDGVCKLGDFGLSIAIPESKLVDGRVGKLGYMAPEVAAGTPYDPVAADLWSLGVSFFILLTGSPLVEMASVECPGFRAFCRLGLRRVLTDWRMINDFSDATLDLLDGMLQVDPLDRISLPQLLNHAALAAAAP